MLQTWWLLILLFISLATPEETAGDDSLNDGYLDTTGLINKYGYPVEKHNVTSADGYIMTAFRIPYGKKVSNASGCSEPVILMHGLFGSSEGWLLKGNESFPFLLANNGCDVWLANGRGNKYSRRHTNLDPEKNAFWLFSWHEQGIYEFPALIDYVLDKTGKERVSCVTHSMGGTIVFVMLSEKPEYNQKLKTVVNFAPACFVGNISSPILQSLARFSDQLAPVISLLYHGEIPPKPLPRPENTNFNDTILLVVDIIISVVTGSFNPREVDWERLTEQSSRPNSGASVRQVQHFGQENKKGCFCKFDYGSFENKIRYGQWTPPDYNLSNVAADLFVFYSNGDSLVTEKDIEKLCNLLKVGHFIKVDEDGFQHSDYLTGKNAYPLVYQKAIDILKGNGPKEKHCPSTVVTSKVQHKSKSNKKSTSRVAAMKDRSTGGKHA